MDEKNQARALDLVKHLSRVSVAVQTLYILWAKMDPKDRLAKVREAFQRAQYLASELHALEKKVGE